MDNLRCALTLLLLAGCGGGQQAQNGVVEDAPDLARAGGPPKGSIAADSPTTTTDSSDAAPGDSPSTDAMLIGDGGAAKVSFAGQIVPLFDRLHCATCHSGNGPGRDLGNLTLDGGNNLIYREVTQELSPNFHTTRVDLKHPEDSLILTLPGPQPDVHPVVVFTTTADPDYQLLLTWIEQGARQN